MITVHGVPVTVHQTLDRQCRLVLFVAGHSHHHGERGFHQFLCLLQTFGFLLSSSVFGFPQQLMSDQGTEFTGDVIAALCKLLGIEKIRTTPYHPQSNGSAERVHQTLQRMIGKLDPEKHRKWPLHIGSVLIAYNATRSQVTGYSPYFLMYGRRPRLPVDLLFPTRNTREWTRTINEYVKNL